MPFLKAERNKFIHTHATLFESILSLGKKTHENIPFMKESLYQNHNETKIIGKASSLSAKNQTQSRAKFLKHRILLKVL